MSIAERRGKEESNKDVLLWHNGMVVGLLGLKHVHPPSKAISVSFQTADLTFCDPLSVTGIGGHTYLYEPLWWAGMITSKQIVGINPCLKLLEPRHEIIW